MNERTSHGIRPGSLSDQGGVVRARPLWLYLAAIIVTAIVPVSLAASALLMRQAAQDWRFHTQGLQVAARSLSLAIDGEIVGYSRLLEALALSPAFQAGDLRRFHGFAKLVAEQEGAQFISLFSADGRQLLNTARPYGAPLPDPFAQTGVQPADAETPPVADVKAIKSAFASGRSSNSDLFRSLSTGRLLFTVNVPVRRAEGQFVLNIGLEPSALREFVAQKDDATGGYAAVLDGNDFILARWRDDGAIGRRARDPVRLARQGQTSAVGEGVTREGGSAVFAAYTSTTTGWTTVVVTEREPRGVAVYRVSLAGALIAAGGGTVGGALAWLLARRVTRSMRNLVDVAGGQSVADDERWLPVYEIRELRRALRTAREREQAAAALREAHIAAQSREAELERTAAGKDRFITTLSHELRNPLAAIVNVVSAMRLGHVNDQSLRILERQTARLTTLVNEFMDAARVTSGQMALAMADVDLRDVVRYAVDACNDTVASRQQSLQWQAPLHAVTVVGDGPRLMQVLIHLIENASKFSDSGAAIDITLRATDDEAVLGVTDRGRGMDAGQIETLFSPFAQPSSSERTADLGFGFGLPLSRQLIALHGGRLVLSSAGPGHGTTAQIRLPLRKQGPGRDGPP